MEPLLAISIGVVVSASVYLFLSRDLLRVLMGFILLGTATNLAILLAGRIGSLQPPLVEAGADALAAGVANPLPQALILTAIVIGFGLTAFALVLVLKSHEAMGVISVEEMDEADIPPASSMHAPAAPRKEAA